ncbi:MAG: ABC transporter ATP-binding protein [Candidatus Lokiarchaeota archaeon]|nr:ABC transporter ATP-binding protein [Candidatus Lokiarchaeota archaeon]
MNSLRMIIKYWMRSKRNFWLSFLFQAISVATSLFPPIFIGRLVGALDPSVPKPEISHLWTYFGISVLFGFFGFLFGRWGRIKSAEVSSRAQYELRSDLQTAIYKQSFAYFDRQETGQLISRATSDVEQTTQIFGFGLATGIQALFQMVGVVTSTILLEIRLAWIFAGIPISLIASLLITYKLKPIFLETRVTFGDLTSQMQENILGAQVVRIFSNQKKAKRKFDGKNTAFYNASVKSAKWSSVFLPLNVVIVGLMFVLALMSGGRLYLSGEIPFSIISTVISYIGYSTWSITIFSNIMLAFVQADSSLVRIQEVFDSQPDVQEKKDAVPVPTKGFKGKVEFEHVTFGYLQSNPILHNISFKVPPGAKIAIIGTTGSGKSSIINLLPRFYDVHQGAVKIDGVDVRDYKIQDLRKNIGIVSQETFMFNRSIAENISFGKDDATLEEIKRVAKIANLDAFIESLSDGYDSLVGERGTRLSGGQKQRLSIARAILVRPGILIFDDSTSSVDVETEYKIQSALEQVMQNTTTFIITQRVSTIRNVDIIIVLDKGRIVGMGEHEELMKDNVLYKQIYETLYRKQKGGFEYSSPVIPGGKFQ